MDDYSYSYNRYCWIFQLGREVLDKAAEAIAVGVTTEEIDKVVHEVC